MCNRTGGTIATTICSILSLLAASGSVLTTQNNKQKQHYPRTLHEHYHNEQSGAIGNDVTVGATDTSPLFKAMYVQAIY